MSRKMMKKKSNKCFKNKIKRTIRLSLSLPPQDTEESKKILLAKYKANVLRGKSTRLNKWNLKENLPRD